MISPTPKGLLWLLIALSLVPASLLVVRRVQAEGARRTVTLLMDEQALAEQASYLGVDSFSLAERYRALGLNGISLYEETLESLAASGRIAYQSGQEAITAAVRAGEPPPEVPADSTLVTALVPGALDAMLAKNLPAAREVRLAGRSWYWYPGDAAGTNPRPVGPNPERIERFASAGYDIAYRPRNYPNLRRVGADFPPEAHYLIYAGLQVTGHPDALHETVDVSQRYLTGIIEGTEQDGMSAIARRVPTARLLSFNQDYINQRLRPAELIDKYLLAADERGVRLLYLRPYTEEQLGNMVANTEALVGGLALALEREGYTIGPLDTLELDYRTSTLLRSLSAIGVLAGLGLLALMYPGVWGGLMAAGVLGLGLLAGGLDWDALALAAALSFPVIGYGHLRERPLALPLATLVSLAGAVLLVAVGSDREAMLAIRPFAGVAATLVVPPALFAFHYALRFHRPAAWVRRLWGHPVRVGEVALVLVAGAALALVVIRRGNVPIIGASSVELAFREWLADLFVRPRFKELVGHPLALLALANPRWAAWTRGGLLTGGVIAQASILNSFSHYHTPLLVSLQRTVIALVLGGLLGLVMVPALRLAVTAGRRWLAGADVQTQT